MVASNIGLLKIVYFPGELGVRFSEALDAAIRALKEQGCGRLIVDPRGKIGGGIRSRTCQSRNRTPKL
jgi:C-terminal processing protease CtpA/Prc